MRKLKRICCLLIAVLLFGGTWGMTAAAKDTWPSGPSIDSECAIVMDRPLWEKGTSEMLSGKHYKDPDHSAGSGKQLAG